MAFTVPNEASATYAPQAAVDSVDLDAFVLSQQITGVVSGCAVTAGTGRTVDVAAGVIQVGGTTVTVSAVTSLAVAAASSFDRKDIIVVSNAGTVSVTQGTASSATTNGTTTAGNRDPVKPAIPANSVILAEIYVNASIGSTMAAGNIVDKRIFLLQSAWIAWTPTFTNITSGAGTFHYLVMGKILYIKGAFSAGTATAAAVIQLTLPSGCTAAATATVINAQNSNALIGANIVGSGTAVRIAKDTAFANWATSDSIALVHFNGVVELA